jgi:predicted dehydrogenase
MEISKLADQKKLSVVVGLQYRYKKSYQLLLDQIQAGALGDIGSISVYYNVGAPVIHPRKPGQTEMEYQMRNWRYFTWLWGGQLAGQTIHQIDVMNWFMNDFPVTARGIGGRQVFKGPDQGNTYDHHYVEFEYANGVKMHVQSRNINNCWTRMGFEVQGAKGTANERSRIYGSDGNTIWRHDDRNDPNPYQVEHDVLFDSIKNGIHHNDTEWGAKSSLTTIMGRMAMHSGQEMHLEEVIKSNRSILPEQFSWDASMPDVPDQSGNYPIPLPGITEVL